MNIDKIYLNNNFLKQEEVFEFLSVKMQEIGVVKEAKDYLDALHCREEQSSTGLIDGFAIPHGRSASIQKAAVIYIRNNQGIEWDSLDGSLARDIFALAIPENGSDHHLDTLVAISTKLMDPEICKQLRSYDDEQHIAEIFER